MTLYRIDSEKAAAIDKLSGGGGLPDLITALKRDGILVETERAPRLQDDPKWPTRWCPVHCCGSVDTFPERYERSGMQGRCYLGVEFDEDCDMIVVEVVVVEDTE